MKNKLFLFVTVFSLIGFISCNNPNTNDEQTTNSTTENDTLAQEQDTHKHEVVHWSHHKGEDGPKNWNHLCDEFVECGGKRQSPINIETNNIVKGDSLVAPVFHYNQSMVDIINNEHTVQFNITGDNTIDLNGEKYELMQFHYHTNSEHTIDGKYYPVEIHFVHVHSDTDYAVLGILVEEGEENELFAKYLDKFPPSKGEYVGEDVDMLSIIDLFPENKSYYYYKGSLTTPPCTEIVNWYIFKTPLTASKEQIAELSEILDHNFRPVMPINDRVVKVFEE